jgi:hypothetical protein
LTHRGNLIGNLKGNNSVLYEFDTSKKINEYTLEDKSERYEKSERIVNLLF